MDKMTTNNTFLQDPGFLKHKGKSYTVIRWLAIIAELSDDPVYKPGQIGKMPKYTKESGIELCSEYLKGGALEQVLKRRSLSRSTVWRWRQKYPSFRDMYQWALYVRRQQEHYEEMLKRRYGY